MNHFKTSKRKQKGKHPNEKLIDNFIKNYPFEFRMKHYKIFRKCEVRLTSCMNLHNNMKRLKRCQINLTNCEYPTIKWHRTKINGILPEVKEPKIWLWKISLKTKETVGKDFNWIKFCK